MSVFKQLDRLAIPVLAAVLILTAAATARAQDTPPAVNYISADAVYLNVGKHAGLRIGSMVQVLRGDTTIAVLEVVHVSSNSASCRVIEQTDAPRVSDPVSFVAAPDDPPVEAAVAVAAITARESSDVEPATNIVSGYVAFQTLWQKDLSGSDISSLQPALTARIRIENVGGTGGELRFRDRIRLYHRTNPPGDTSSDNEWYHRLTELAYVYRPSGADLHWGAGRVIVPHMIAVGQIDGGYLTYKFSRYFRIGAVAGFDPDPIGMSIDFDRQRIGAYLGFDYESVRNWRFASSAALTASRASSTVNRDFVYWQNIFSLNRVLSVFQSVEMDINRDWRRDANGESISFSNFFITANGEVTRYATIDLRYDSRKNVRTYDTMATPDSLFDDRGYDGYGGGLTLRVADGVTLGGRAGIRHRESNTTNKYFSLYGSTRRLPWRGHAVSLRYGYAQTQFTTGHRPRVDYRFPAGRRLRLNVSAGGYLYELGTQWTNSFYAEGGAYYPFKRYFASGSYRQYFSGNLDSIVLFAELGINL